MSENRPNEGKKAFSVSALPDFSQVYSFLQYFGCFFHLPPITLNELEKFFENEFVCTDSPVVYAHWKLLNNVCKREGKDRWQHMAVKFARRCEVVREMVLYSELTIEQRVKVFRLTCEEQFDSNAGFKLELKKQLPAAAMQWEPLGTDSDGQRHWMLRDSTFDVRLYGERGYDEVPPKSAVWEQLARSLEELAVYIGKLEARWKTGPACTSDNESPDEVSIQSSFVLENCKKGFSELGENCDSPHVRSGEERNDRLPSKAGRRLASKKTRSSGLKKAGKKEAAVMEEEVGCLKCHKDTNYKQMLLCDECDKECHMYCQYPVLWSVPHGKWICPLCKEKHLFANLKRLYSELSEARNHFERTMERKQRSIARLQKAGLHLQNIIDEGESDSSTQRRSRRARKDVNYAELNDFYLPPLGHNDLVGSRHNNCSDISTAGQARVTVGNDYGVPRIRFSRRLRGISRDEDEREEERGDSVTKEEESGDHSSCSASDKFESLEPDSLPESENEDDRDCLQTADSNEENEMDETSSISTEVDDGCLNTFELRRGSGDLSIMVPDVDIQTGNDEGPTQPQTTSTLSRDKIFSLDLETSITTISPVTEPSTHSGM